MFDILLSDEQEKDKMEKVCIFEEPLTYKT